MTTLIGSILKAVACTPNKNDDPTAYEREVIEPCKRLRAMAEEIGERAPSESEAKEAVAILVRVLAAKKVDEAEQKRRLGEIARATRLEWIGS